MCYFQEKIINNCCFRLTDFGRLNVSYFLRKIIITSYVYCITILKMRYEKKLKIVLWVIYSDFLVNARTFHINIIF